MHEEEGTHNVSPMSGTKQGMDSFPWHISYFLFFFFFDERNYLKTTHTQTIMWIHTNCETHTLYTTHRAALTRNPPVFSVKLPTSGSVK